MKNIMTQAENKFTIAGKLLDTTFGEGTLSSDGRHYKRANLTVRVTQTYGGRTETSEIPVSMFAAQLTNAGKPNPGYKQIEALAEMKTAQNVGIDNADSVRITGANIRENNFVSKTSGQLINGWQINTSFINPGVVNETASFVMEIFIINMTPEMDRNENETGRMIIKGGVVQYNGKLDIIDFIVENPDTVDYISRNWNINDTVQIKGRVRVTAQEEKPAASEHSWGEDVPETTTRTVRELIITIGSDTPYEEDFAYSEADIRKAFNVRKALIEQLQLDAQKGSKNTTKEPASKEKKWDWE